MIYCGSVSGSYFGKVLVPVPDLPVQAPVPAPDPDLFSTVFQHQKICTKPCLFNARSSIVSQKVGLKFFFCLLYWYHTFYVGFGKSPLRQKFAILRFRLLAGGGPILTTAKFIFVGCFFLFKSRSPFYSAFPEGDSALPATDWPLFLPGP
jgi:hypothetical protein